MKRVLVVSYSQSGQLDDIVRAVIAPLSDCEGIQLHHERLVPETPFPFPWGVVDFLDVFPECVQLDPPPLRPPGIPANFVPDVVILAYQVWYLAPALPMTAFLQGEIGRSLLAGRPVITLVACRNMWLTAQATMQRLIAGAGGQLQDHLAFVDGGHPLATFITTPRWVLTGRRNAFCGLPPAGVSPEAIRGAARFGHALREVLVQDALPPGPWLAGLRAVEVNPRLAVSERAGARAFKVWSRLIRLAGRRGEWRRRPLLLVFAIYLVVMILTVVPLSLLLQWLLRPLLRRRLANLKARLEEPSGSQAHRLSSKSVNDAL